MGIGFDFADFDALSHQVTKASGAAALVALDAHEFLFFDLIFVFAGGRRNEW